MKVQELAIGGWFQRTTLHLAELYDFISEGTSPLDLDPERLQKLRTSLDISSQGISFEVNELECVIYTTNTNIKIKLFEDGLITLHLVGFSGEIQKGISTLTDYYETVLSPAVSYLFSLGAPVPKELANIKTIYPYFVVAEKASEAECLDLLVHFEQKLRFDIKQSGFEIYRGDKLFIINNLAEELSSIERFIEEQVFMREFKGQLHRYLNLHRSIWEKIAAVKEKGEIKGRDVKEFYTKIESYSKTINLIDARIEQMDSYLSTRKAMVKDDEKLADFVVALEFKHETLANTLKYIKGIWRMTKNYVDSADKLFASIQSKATEASVKNLTIITSMGVGATLIGLFSQKAPQFTVFGLGYFIVLVAVGYSADKIMKWHAKRSSYIIRDVETAKDL
jgi:hypothetical protein